MTSTFDWSVVAPAWEELRAHADRATLPVAERLLAHLALQGGDRVLELGAGTGDLALHLSGLVGPDGVVHATDAAAGMVEVAARTTAGSDNVTTAVVDATDIPLPDASVDAVVFQMGLMFVPEPARATAEIRRVLAPGGRVAVATWAAPEHNPWLTCTGMAAMSEGVVAGGPPTHPGGLFSLGTAEALRSALEAGGLAGVQVEEVPVELRFADSEAYADHVTRMAGPLAAAIGAAPQETQQRVRATAATLVSRWLTAEGVVVPGLALVASATR
jgi:SAM-dependent methyltransferase